MGATTYLLPQNLPFMPPRSPSLQKQLAGKGCAPSLKELPVYKHGEGVLGGDKGRYRRRELG